MGCHIQYDSPEAWLRRIAFRSAQRRRQRNAARPHHESLADVLDGSSSGGAPASALLRDALKPLAAPERDALMLRYFWDRSIHELAERFGCTEAAMRVRLHRACRRARENLMGLCGAWVMDTTWSSSALECLLQEHGYRLIGRACAAEPQ